MMKKISKLALLAAATAFLLAAFPACSDDDDGNETEQTGGGETTGGDTAGGDTTGGDNNSDEGNTPAFTNWTANLSAISTELSGEKDSSTPPKVTVTAEKTVDTAFIIYSPSGRIRVRDDNTLNYNGGTAAAFATTDVDGTLAETIDRYVGVDTSKLTSSGNVKVTISVKAVNSSSATGDVGQVVLVDENNKILAYHGDVKIKTGNDTFDIDATVAAGTKVIVGFSRAGAGGGGIDVTALKAEAAN